MTDFTNQITDSDLDAFKNSGEIQSASITISGSLGSSAQATYSTTITQQDSPDITQILFDNSVNHSGKFKPVVTEGYTIVTETTFGSELAAWFGVSVSGGSITIRVTLLNPYVDVLALQSTTLNFKFIPYESTF